MTPEESKYRQGRRSNGYLMPVAVVRAAMVAERKADLKENSKAQEMERRMREARPFADGKGLRGDPVPAPIRIEGADGEGADMIVPRARGEGGGEVPEFKTANYDVIRNGVLIQEELYLK